MQSARVDPRGALNGKGLRGPCVFLTASVLALGALCTALMQGSPTYTLSLGEAFVGQTVSREEAAEGVRAYYEGLLSEKVTLVAGDAAATFSRQELGLTVDIQTEVDRVLAQLDQAPWYYRLPGFVYDVQFDTAPVWNEDRFAQAIAQLRASVTREASPAFMELVGDVPVITPETAGSRLSVSDALRAVSQAGRATSVTLPVQEVVPEVTAASLGQLGIRRLIAAWTTEYDPTIPRAENVERAARSFDGLMLAPGEVLSYNETVGPITSETGWREAFVIVNGQLVPGIGGGVCQVATTLYGAALRANLQIVERHPHHLAVSYIAPSQDAAISQGWEDLQVRNTTDGHLLIRTESSGGRVTVRIYGDLPPGLEVKIESQVLGSQPFQTEYISDPALRAGQEVVQQWGSAGLISEAYRLVYQNGELVARELLSRDRYLPTTQVVARGPSSQPTAAPSPSAENLAGASPEPVNPATEPEEPTGEHTPDPDNGDV